MGVESRPQVERARRRGPLALPRQAAVMAGRRGGRPGGTCHALIPAMVFPRLHACMTAATGLLLLGGCDLDGAADLRVSAEVGETGKGKGEEALNCDAPSPGPMPVRRLSHREYRYALEDLFGRPQLAQQAASRLVSDPTSLGFSNSATLLDVKPVLGQQYMETAEWVAEELVKDLGALLSCDAQADPEGCAQALVTSLGERAYRRPVTSEERAAYLAKFHTLRAEYDFATAAEWLIATVLQSPHFLYRYELDEGAAASVRAVRPQELAQRLSFFIWHSAPDAALLAAAAEGRLQTAEDVAREAKRMLSDPRGTRFLHFFEEWLDVDKLGTYTREAAAFGSLPDDLPALLREETRAVVRHVMFEAEEKPTLQSLLTADFTFANDRLAAHYGLSAVHGASFQKVAQPPGRIGVWMLGGPLSSHDKPTRTSIVNRGIRVRTALLCHNIPAPPDDVSLTLGPIDQTASQADRLAEHRTNPSCAGCHGLIDPLGQAFENVDGVGRLRTEDEAGRPVDTRGHVTSTRDADGAVTDGAHLMERLAQSEQVRSCFATQLFRYAFGREEREWDACTQKQVWERFEASGFDLRELVIGIVTSDAFLYREVRS